MDTRGRSVCLGSRGKGIARAVRTSSSPLSHPPSIHAYPHVHVRRYRSLACPAETESEEPLTSFSPIGSKANVAAFAPLGREIITGHESGKVGLFDAETGEEIESNEKAHLGQVSAGVGEAREEREGREKGNGQGE